MLQFGTPLPGKVHVDRPAAFGIAVREGLIALVRVGEAWLDLPGGAVDPGEDELGALVREFGEETGLIVRPGRLIVRAAQYFELSGARPVNNRFGAYEVSIEGEDAALKIEDDHALVWLAPENAIAGLRHDGHAWAVASWLRTHP